METVIHAILRPLLGYVEDPQYEEIAINRPGEVWCRQRNGRDEEIWIRIDDPALSHTYLLSVCHAIANSFDQSFDPFDGEKPSTVFASIPPHGHRFAAIAGACVEYDLSTPEGGIAMCIRQGIGISKHSAPQYQDWGLERGRGTAISNLHRIKLTDPERDALGAILDAVKHHVHLLISGGTSTGKTQLMNRIMNEMPTTNRIVTVEDTRELMLPNHPNHVHLLLSRTERKHGFTYASAIDIITRFTPDAVVVGEVSSSNASALWNLTGTGHGAMIATIHAASPEEAQKTLLDRISGSSHYQIDRAETLRSIRERFCIIQLERTPTGIRRVVAVHPPEYPDGKGQDGHATHSANEHRHRERKETHQEPSVPKGHHEVRRKSMERIGQGSLAIDHPQEDRIHSISPGSMPR